MTIRELVENVQSIYSKGVYSDDARLSNRHIYSMAKSIREKLLSQDLKKKQSLSSFDYTTIPCMEVILVPKEDCPCIPPTGCSIYRTRYKIPRPIKGFNEEHITHVGFNNRTFDFIREEFTNTLKGEKYPTEKYFIKDGYIFFVTKKPLKIVTIRGSFSDPIEAEKIISFCEKQECKDCNNCENYLDKEFPTSNTMAFDIIEIIKETLLKLFMSSIEDVSNNTLDGPKENSK